MPSGLTGREVPLPLWQPAPGPLTAILGAGADSRAAKRLQVPVALCTCPALLPSLGTGILLQHRSAAPLTCLIFAASFAHLRTCPCLPDLHPPLTSQLGCAFSAVSREPSLKLLFNHTTQSPVLPHFLLFQNTLFTRLSDFVSLTRM